MDLIRIPKVPLPHPASHGGLDLVHGACCCHLRVESSGNTQLPPLQVSEAAHLGHQLGFGSNLLFPSPRKGFSKEADSQWSSQPCASSYPNPALTPSPSMIWLEQA